MGACLLIILDKAFINLLKHSSKELSVKLAAFMDYLKLLHIGKKVDNKSLRKSSLLTESDLQYLYIL